MATGTMSEKPSPELIAGTTQFLYDGDELVAEYDGSNVIKHRYVHGPGTDEPIAWYDGAGFGTNRRRLQEDRHGSIVSVTDSAGNLIAINSYDEYGIPAATNLGRFQYTGQAWIDELGMYYYKARIYSPTLGRFMQTDPIGYEDQMNLYAYVSNDPVNGGDPTGRYETTAEGKEADKIAGYYNDMKNALKGLEPGSKEYRNLAEIIKYIGAPGEKTGVTIGVDSLPPGTMGVADPGGKIRLDINHIEERARYLTPLNPGMNVGHVAQSFGAGILGHEGDHQMAMSSSGIPDTSERVFEMEMRGARVQASVDRGLRVRTGMWDRRMKPKDIDRAIRAQAGMSTNAWIANGRRR